MILVRSFVVVLIRKARCKRLSCVSGTPKWAKCTKGAVQNSTLEGGQEIIELLLMLFFVQKVKQLSYNNI